MVLYSLDWLGDEMYQIFMNAHQKNDESDSFFRNTQKRKTKRGKTGEKRGGRREKRTQLT